ncbi:C6 zinc finger [Aspergillus sclerotialis]|uniref:C6 zinc finger n=1 Tax=Aspergillus sclerotialis TaxID=2070753 RepID=A0A3A2ZM23_9EURO|nr:C6 zinc finger [Aspergillus sclerotialis]
METSTSLDPTASKRQCWECVRRRLVCDSSEAGCNKCSRAGIVCPGYNDNKPLKWLTPGKTTSLIRRHRQASPPRKPLRQPASSREAADKTQTPQHGRENEMPQMTVFLGDLGDGTRAAVDAALYYKSEIYPRFAPMHQLEPSPYITPIMMGLLRFFPVSFCHTMAYLVLGHRIQHIVKNVDSSQIMEMRSRLLYHRGLAIRAVNEDVASVKTNHIDLVIGSVMMLLFSEIRESASSDWRHHFDGAAELIKLRGGLENTLRSCDPMRPALLYFLVIGVITNTTSPPSHHITITSQLDLINLMAELYGDGLFPVLLCPPYLFLDIIKINHLRFQAIKYPADEFVRSAALELLEHIEAFLPERWIRSNASAQDEWLLLGHIYRSAVALYCILSLQSLSILQSTEPLRMARVTHQALLLQSLQKAFFNPLLKKSMMWPLLVAGMSGINADANTREFIDEQLLEMSGDLATPVPLAARALFKQFWRSGKASWDECFDKSYAFVS